MQNPKIVFFDIDDTIYRKYTDTLRPSVAQAMSALKQRGILTAIATGRAPVAIPAKIQNLIREAGIDLVITINGQYCEFRNQPLRERPLDTDTIAKMCRFYDSKGIAYAFVGSDNIAVSEPTEWAEEALAKILPVHLTDKDYYLNHPVYQMLVFYDESQDAEMNAEAAKAGLKNVRWHAKAVDTLHAEESKAQGIAAAVGMLGIDMQDVMAFGDGLNDVDMLKSVGFGVAMGNGTEQTKAAAKYVCPSVDEDGVLRGLQALGVID
ncbi:Cof-type HAD-IIB family hydrolase [Neisseria perflava]|uniref:Cof-type HAD-IIB family hydrolase n=1 Tax=Neisseria perflava TaxID=33053 RepID=UPI00209F441E|nr:Cof-type HAD-IIB family hydrolase [Neisseria perflava]MCP1659393.1 Cof subfamily protein (haloacid dehalogenase superfamily) [Neisseria perflava]MCP1772164.1 Cof subfamily protein (haloacid dehalogenase superfamily) [Neisseria perflava]